MYYSASCDIVDSRGTLTRASHTSNSICRLEPSQGKKRTSGLPVLFLLGEPYASVALVTCGEPRRGSLRPAPPQQQHQARIYNFIFLLVPVTPMLTRTLGAMLQQRLLPHSTPCRCCARTGPAQGFSRCALLSKFLLVLSARRPLHQSLAAFHLANVPCNIRPTT